MRIYTVLPEPLKGNKILYPNKIARFEECESLLISTPRKMEQAKRNQILKQIEKDYKEDKLDIYTLPENELNWRYKIWLEKRNF